MAISVIFFGSSEYSTIILRSLVTLPQFPLITIVTKPDKPVGRFQQIQPNPVSAFAQTHHLPLLQPETFDANFVSQLKSLKPDLGLCVAYGPPFFTQEIIDIPQYKIINIHPSPLPKYRGATPGPWQIINGETKSAVTFFQIDPLPDHGPVIAKLPLNISPDETSGSFYTKAFSLAAVNLAPVLESYIMNLPAGRQVLKPQNHSQKSYYPKLTKESAQIDWSWDPAKIYRFINALNPWPIAWTYVQNQTGQKFKMKIFSFNTEPVEVQIEGKKPASWDQLSSHYQILK